jgi:Holliday junction resolvasome RuvABC DNA-binding subunit
LEELQGNLQIVDPYCGIRTLDILRDIGNKEVKFLTRIEYLNEKERERFLRELKDFKTEYPTVKFRNYPDTDIHDRYVISANQLVVLGHSLKDFGSKESFAIVLNRETSKNIVEALIEIFNRRWKQAIEL